ncbi:hypothetical protein CAOG_01150 [Capsaspora owczarzaki ATCC 30864]|uniref:Peptidase M3A/M3B catalytic domain-containing protein n=1 Tax=Capsaspora owczarzaki (strain ATCC 30864) TaxID=595528 RepID=A0A0D2X0V5_CAPO3|nr:hypothetical protein CAOG_01150 [Capsaspora owczarzaki ATCC 30864]KJE89719.1 hypothetical protein CAOG_001150 [Capsaspora owczarzaki ATCC 30864]|eukprot:XP_004366021.2 hypothetical protein CAOG_01150 [Capsaspora owczarzaki ATCC 30864]
MLRLGTLIRLAPRLQSATVVVPPNNNAAAAAAVYVAHSPARRSIAGLAEMLDGNARRSSSNGRGAGLESAPFGTGSVGGGVGGGSGMDGMLHPTALQYGGYGAGGAFGGSSSSSSFSSATGTGTGAGTGTAKLAGAHNGALYCDPVTGEVQWPQPCSVPPEQPGSLFGVTGLCTPADFATATTRTLTECARIVSCIPTVEGPMIVRAMDELSNIICSLSDPCEFIRQNHTNETIRQVAQDTCQTLHAFVDRLNTHRGIQIALDSFINDKATFDAQDYDLRRTAELFMSDFVLHGLHLPEGKERDQVVQLNEEILGQGYLFTREDSPTETFIINSNVYNTLTPSMRSQCRGRNDGNYDAPLAMASNCPDHLPEPTRKRLFIAAAEARPDRLDALVKMLRARYDLAKLLGYPSHVHRVVRQDAYLENPEVLRTFLERLSERIREPVRRDLATLRRLQVNPSQDINPWDLAPLANRLTCVNEDVLEYFSLGNCLTALQEIVRNLFDVELRWVEMQPGELWAPHVYKIAVYHAKATCISIFLDLFSRRGKSDKSANYMIRGSCERLDGRWWPCLAAFTNHHRANPSASIQQHSS